MRVGIVDRRDPARQAAAAEIARLFRHRKVTAVLGETGQHLIVDANPDDIVDAADIGVEVTVLALEVLDPRHLGEGVGELGAHRLGVQVDHVERIPGVFHHLQPVARRFDQVRDHFVAVLDHGVEHRERRHGLARPHVGKRESLVFNDRIGAETGAFLQSAADRFAGAFLDRTVDAVLPAVIAAADAALLDDAKFERHVAMRAVQVHQAEPAAVLAKQHQVFAHDTNTIRQVADLVGHRHRHPVAAQILAAGRSRADLGQFRVRLAVPDELPVVAAEIWPSGNLNCSS